MLRDGTPAFESAGLISREFQPKRAKFSSTAAIIPCVDSQNGFVEGDSRRMSAITPGVHEQSLRRPDYIDEVWTEPIMRAIAATLRILYVDLFAGGNWRGGNSQAC